MKEFKIYHNQERGYFAMRKNWLGKWVTVTRRVTGRYVTTQYFNNQSGLISELKRRYQKQPERKEVIHFIKHINI